MKLFKYEKYNIEIKAIMKEVNESNVIFKGDAAMAKLSETTNFLSPSYV